MDDAAMEKLMFDDSFELSKYYFTLLQLLRISSEWIDEAVGSFKALKTALIDRRSKSPMMVPNESEWHKVLKNCDIVSLVLEESAGEIKSRVNRKTEEVKSLRDGVRTLSPVCVVGILTTLMIHSSSLMQLLCAKRQREWR